MNNKDITVLFLLYKTPFYLIKNLKPLKKFKILILDQSGDYILKKEIEKILPNIQYYGIKKRNRGFAKGINFLVKKVKTKYFLCIQPDVLVEEKSIFKLKQIIKKDKKSILAIPRIKGVKNFKFNYLSKKKTTNADYFIGALFLADLNKFKEIGMFDENFFFYWEDIDLTNRIKKKGYKILLNLNDNVLHLGGKSSKNKFSSLILRNSNFKFGEYLYKYKNNDLKMIKIIREPITNFFYSVFNLILLDFRNFLIRFSYLIGILKFFIFLNFKKNEIKKKN